MQRILLLNADNYTFADRNDPNRQVAVRKVTYTDGIVRGDDRSKGAGVLTVPATPDALACIGPDQLPGVFDAILTPIPRGKQVTLECQALSFVRRLDFSQVLAEKAG